MPCERCSQLEAALREIERRAALPITPKVSGLPSSEVECAAAVAEAARLTVAYVVEPIRALLSPSPAAPSPAGERCDCGFPHADESTMGISDSRASGTDAPGAGDEGRCGCCEGVGLVEQTGPAGVPHVSPCPACASPGAKGGGAT